MFEGMPWSIFLPIAILALIYGTYLSKKEIAEEDKKKSLKS